MVQKVQELRKSIGTYFAESVLPNYILAELGVSDTIITTNPCQLNVNACDQVGKLVTRIDASHEGVFGRRRGQESFHLMTRTC